MEGRQRLGAVLIVVGIGMVAIGAASLLGGPSPIAARPTTGASASVSATPATATVAVPVATVVITAGPTAAPTDDPLAIVQAFFAGVQASIRAGSQGDLAMSLGEATIERYGLDQCATALASRAPVPEQAFDILGILPPAPWDYVTDGLTTTIPNTTTVEAQVTAPDATGAIATEARELHVQVVEGNVFWFTDCGEPLSAP